MSRSCDITGKGPMSGNNVSHSKRRTKRRFLPNLQNVTLLSSSLMQKFKLRICTSTLRSIDANGGFDSFLLATSNNNLTDNAIKIKKAVKEKTSSNKTVS